MAKTAAILVSIGNPVYSNPISLTRLLGKIVDDGIDEVHLIIGCSLRRWNLMSLGISPEDALTKAVHEGDVWCQMFEGLVLSYLGNRFKGTIRWEELRTQPKFQYVFMQKQFGQMCNKKKVLTLLTSILERQKVSNLQTLLTQIPELNRERARLFGDGKSHETYVEVSWENVMASTILEYAIRHFQSYKTNTEASLEVPFMDFLMTRFFPYSYEHLSEETVGLYRCLIPAGLKFHRLYYPNGIAPILKKAYTELVSSKGYMHWETVKIDEAQQSLLEIQIQRYFNHVRGLNGSQKIMLMQCVRPLCAMISATKNLQKQTALILSLTGFFSLLPQFLEKGGKISTGLDEIFDSPGTTVNFIEKEH